MKTWIKRFVWLIIGLTLLTSVFKPSKNEGGYTDLAPFLAETKPTPEVKAMLQNACFDCHSSQTNYPWYNAVGPIAWWLNHHIEEGKEHFDMSAWSTYSAKRKDHKLEELAEWVENGEMPLESYTWTHGDAELSQEQVKLLVNWAQAARIQYQGVFAQ